MQVLLLWLEFESIWPRVIYVLNILGVYCFSEVHFVDICDELEDVRLRFGRLVRVENGKFPGNYLG